MTLTITGRHCTVPEELRERVQARMEALVRLEPRIDSATVTFAVDHGVNRAEARACVGGAQTMVAHGSGDNFASAFDVAFDRLDRQLHRRVEQSRSRHAHKQTEITPGV